jgi:photosystem II stability/assembly factor-like uncharacterized protein
MAADTFRGVVYGLAATPEGVCFAAGETGLYRSVDGYKTWHFAYETLDFEKPPLTFSVATSPDYAEDHSLFAGVPGGVLRSGDSGSSWHVAGLGSPPPSVISLVISPNFAEDGALFAGTMEDGVFCSTDRGLYWSSWNFGLLDLNVICLAVSPGFAEDETVFAGTETGLFCSTNGGRAWRESGFPTDAAPVLCLAISTHFANDGVVYAGTERGLLRTNDGGQTWATLQVSGAVNAILPSSDARLLIACDTQLLDSSDAGKSWQARDTVINSGITAMIAPNCLDQPVLVAPAAGGLSWV